MGSTTTTTTTSTTQTWATTTTTSTTLTTTSGTSTSTTRTTTATTINSPPSFGACKVEPKQGITLETRFNLTAPGWVDEHLPLTYRFSVRPAGDEKASWSSLSSRSEAPEARYLLIGGVGNFTIRVGVRDAQGLEASSTCSVEMLAPVVAKTNEELKEIISDAVETLPTEDAIRLLMAVSLAETTPASSKVVAVSEDAPAVSDDGGDPESDVAAETTKQKK